jgi:hypothetical protein
MTNREQIVALRGSYVRKSLLTLEIDGVVVSLVGLGYENYPEPECFQFVVDGAVLNERNSGMPITDTQEDVLLAHALQHTDGMHKVFTQFFDAWMNQEVTGW